MRELEKPGRDPREDAPAPVLRSDVLSMEDLNEALQGGAALSLIPIGIGTIVGIGIVGFFAHHFMKKGDEARRNDPNRFKRLK